MKNYNNQTKKKGFADKVDDFIGVIMPLRDKATAFVPAFCRLPAVAPVVETV